MKKLRLILVLCLVGMGLNSMAQVPYQYLLNLKQGTWSALTDGSQMFTPTASQTIKGNYYYSNGSNGVATTTTPGTFAGFPIGFDFKYNDVMMDQFVLAANGYIVLGKDNVTLAGTLSGNQQWGEAMSNMVGITTNFGLNATIATTDISYKTIGTAPNRVLVVQYVDLPNKTNAATTNYATYQIRLYETSNKVEFVLNNYAITAPNNAYVRFVMKGTHGNTTNGSYVITTSVLSNATTTKSSDYANSSINMAGLTIPENWTCEFTPPPACAEAAQPTNLVLTTQTSSKDAGVKGRFNKAADADGYLVVYSQGAFTGTPVNTVNYTDSLGKAIGNGFVGAFTADTTFSFYGLQPEGIEYTISVFSVTYNSCFPLYKYTAAAPLTGVTTTDSIRVPKLELVSLGTDSVVLHVIPSKKVNNRVVIGVSNTSAPYPSNLSAARIVNKTGNWGAPKDGSLVEIGTVLEDGGKIVAYATSDSLVVIKGLKPYVLYHFRAWTYFEEVSEYSTPSNDIDTTTIAKVPYVDMFDNMVRTANLDYVMREPWTVSNLPVHVSNGYRMDVAGPLSAPPAPLYSQPVFWLKSNGTGFTTGYIETPWIQLSSASSHTVTCNYGYNVSGMATTDSVVVELFDGTNFTPIYTFVPSDTSKLQDMVWPFSEKNINFTGHSGELVKIRIRPNIPVKTFQFILSKLAINPTNATCPAPKNLKVTGNTMYSSDVTLAWTAGDQETQWKLRYSELGTSEYYEERTVNAATTYVFKGMPAYKNLRFEVQAVCSPTNKSAYVPSINAAYIQPKMPIKTNFFAGGSTQAAIPSGWMNNVIAHNADGSITIGAPATITTGWAGVANYMGNITLNKGSIRCVFPRNAILGTFAVDFGDRSVGYNLKFRASTLTNGNQAPFTAVEFSDSAVIRLVYVPQGTTTIPKDSNILMEWRGNDIKTMLRDNTFELALPMERLPRFAHIAFYMRTASPYSNTGGQDCFSITDFELAPSCAPIENLRIESLTENSAEIAWTDNNLGTLQTNFWAGVQGTTSIDEIIGTSVYTMNNLMPRTDFEANVAIQCANGAWSPVQTIYFTTPSSTPCPDLTNVMASEIKRKSAVISANPMRIKAASYNYIMKYREVGATEWDSTASKSEIFPLVSLQMGTQYEYMMQAMCSKAPGDMSNLSAVQTFTTVPQSCFTPYNLTLDSVGYYNLKFSWSDTSKLADYGDTIRYDISINKSSNAVVAPPYKKSDEKSYTASGLSENSTYYIRIRSNCGLNNSNPSEWVIGDEALQATTLKTPACKTPLQSELKVDNITETSANLSWDYTTDENNIAWTVTIRDGLDSVIAEAKDLTAKSYTATELSPNTDYIFYVLAQCAYNTPEDGISKDFSTLGTAVGNTFAKEFRVYGFNGKVNIRNINGNKITKVELLNSVGQSLLEKTFNRDGDIEIESPVKNNTVIVKIFSNNKVAVYNLYVK